MKTPSMTKAILNSLTVSILIISIVPADTFAHCKGKHTGNHEHCTGGDGSGNTDLGGDYTATDGVTFTSDVGSFDYQITGTPAQDEIYAGGGTDLIEGGESNDKVWARGGADEIHGDGGNDEIEAGDGPDLVFGGEGDDRVSGGGGDDIIFGGPGDDKWLRGGEGTDSLYGGDGDDTLSFSLGALSPGTGQYELDVYDGGAGQDSLFFDYGNDYEIVEQVNVDLTLGTYEAMARDPSEVLVIANGGFSNIESIWGSNGNDDLRGNDAHNVLYGHFGDDIIYSYGGDDEIIGGPDNDLLYAGPGSDYLRGDSGDDVLYGEEGDDILDGHWDNDELHGGEGCDIFTFEYDIGTDTIMDFEYPYNEPNCELINLSYSDYWRVDFRNVTINTVGDDIIIDVVVKRMGGAGGTIILKNAYLNGVTVDESNFIFVWPPHEL
jgi:Ca2+-binding RTX toxin-like protein